MNPVRSAGLAPAGRRGIWALRTEVGAGDGAEVGAIVGGHVMRVLRVPFVLAGSHGQAVTRPYMGRGARVCACVHSAHACACACTMRMCACACARVVCHVCVCDTVCCVRRCASCSTDSVGSTLPATDVPLEFTLLPEGGLASACSVPARPANA